MSGALADALNETRAAELKRATRALLARPLLTATGSRRDEFLLVRRHAAELTNWFEATVGWRLTVDSEVARLRKRMPEASGPARPARDSRSGAAFTRRRYVVFALALAALERAESQTTLGRLADAVVTAAAAPELRTAGIEFTLGSREERTDMVAVVRHLLDLGVLRRVAGSEESFVSAHGDALYDLERRVLATLLVTGRGPSTVDSTVHDERLAAIVEEPVSSTDELRHRHYRRSIIRRLLDNPVLYYVDLGDDERSYLVGQRRSITDRITAATGLVAEVRAEGIAMVDPDDELTDLRMPETGTDGHATLLVAEFLGRNGSPTTVTDVVDHLGALVHEHRSHWRKNSREPGAAADLALLAIERLEALSLVRVAGGVIHPLPALSRYSVGDARVSGATASGEAGDDGLLWVG